MQYRRSEKTDLLILETLAKKKEYAQYDMKKLLKKTYRTVIRRIQVLEYSQFIRLARTEPGQKGGKDRKIYTLTLHGMITYLKSLKDFSDLDNIVNNHKNLLPLIFGKWSFFEKHGFKELVKDRLKDYVSTNPNIPVAEPPKANAIMNEATIRKLKEAHNLIRSAGLEEYEHSMNVGVLFLLHYSEKEARQQFEFMASLKQDDDLNKFMSQEIENMIKDTEEKLLKLQQFRETWISL